MVKNGTAIRNYFLISIMALLIAAASAVADMGKPEAVNLGLTPSEESWLKNHKIVRVGIDPVFPPLKFAEKGVIKGIEPDYLELLSQYTGIKFELVVAKFTELDAKAKSGELEMFISYNIPERKKFMTFTDPFMDSKHVIIARNDTPFISGIGSLKDKKVAGVKGVKVYDKLFAPYPEIKIVWFDTMQEVFRAVSESRADALISKTFYAGYMVQNHPNLKIAGIVDMPPEPYLYAVRKDYPELVSILNKAIRAIPKDRVDAITQKWFTVRLDYRANWSDLLKWFWGIGTVIALVLGLTIFWNRRLAKEIKIRNMAEEALRVSEKQLRVIFETTGAGIIMVSAKGIIEFANRRMAEMFDMTVEEVTGTPYPRHLHKSEMRVGDEKMRQLIAGEIDSVWLERHYIRRDGTDFWGHLSGSRLENPDGTLRAIVGVITDITDRKNMEVEKKIFEQQLQQTQKLESLGVLAGGIAHDFNNILAIIMGNCSLAQMDKENAENRLIEIQKASERAAGLCRQMLAYAGKGQLSITQINMIGLVDEMIRLLKASLPQNAVIKPDFSADIPPVKGDASQIRQVVMNLIINASEAIGEEQGEIRVSLTRTVRTNKQPDKDYHGKKIPAGEYLCLEVTDSGCGMDEETRWRIFEPFYTTKFTGRGLGMSAVLGIIMSHNGALQLFSQPGHGSTFKVYLPASQDESEEEKETKSPEIWRGSGTILLVEDEEQVRQIAKNLLEMFGFTVLEAENGREALEIYRQHSAEIKLVFTDIGMPVMDGYHLFHELKKLSQDIPIIVSSGFGDADVSARLGSDNVAGLISKPYNPAQLQEILKGATA